MASDIPRWDSPLGGSSVDQLSSGDFELIPPYQPRRVEPSLVSSGEEVTWCVTAGVTAG